MPRIRNLKGLMFPVAEAPLFAETRTGLERTKIAVSGKRALIDTASHRVVGIVGAGYRVVTNEQALQLATRCCNEVFPETKEAEWAVEAADAPSTAGHCFIDLVHNSTALDFTLVASADRPEAFGPFIRVTNSYNGLRALAFDIGLFRKVCKNGLILPGSLIRFRFSHSRDAMNGNIDFSIGRDRIATAMSGFQSCFGMMRDCKAERGQFEPLMLAVLGIRRPAAAKTGTRESEAWVELMAHVTEQCDRYQEELGATVYAIFNAITEFASDPPVNRCIGRERHGYQRRAGAWVAKFHQAHRKPNFNLNAHIAETQHVQPARPPGSEATTVAAPHRTARWMRQPMRSLATV